MNVVFFWNSGSRFENFLFTFLKKYFIFHIFNAMLLFCWQFDSRLFHHRIYL